MELKPIRSDADYQLALAQVERLWDAPAKSREAEQLEVLVMLIEDYEQRHYPILDPDPIDFLLHVMESRGLSRKDLAPCLGPRGRVSDVLNRNRPLTLGMIRRLVTMLHLPAEVLIQPYELQVKAA